MLMLINDGNRLFYGALQNKDQAVFWHQLGHFTVLAMIFVVIAVYRFYLTQLLQLKWRTWMTRDLMGRWLHSQAFYRIELARYDQPEQTLYGRLRNVADRAEGVLLSIGHRPSVADFHPHRWQFVIQPDGAPARYRLRINGNS